MIRMKKRQNFGKSVRIILTELKNGKKTEKRVGYKQQKNYAKGIKKKNQFRD